jgi:nicotinamide riboside transporter PnuC
MRVLGREPAQFAAALAAAVQLVTALFLPLSVTQQGAVNAVCVAVAGLFTALAVSKEKAAPLIAGLLQAIIALALAFGIALSPDMQSTLMSVVATVGGWWLRTQVWAPVPPEAVAANPELA